MPRTSFSTPEAQRERFVAAVKELGGNHRVAAMLGMGERSIRALRNGEREIHEGHLRDLAQALTDKAARCMQLEREISPAFKANLTAAQHENFGKPDGRRFDQSIPYDTGTGAETLAHFKLADEATCLRMFRMERRDSVKPQMERIFRQRFSRSID